MNINLNEFVMKLLRENSSKDLELNVGIEFFLSFQKSNRRPATYYYYKNHLQTISKYLNSRNIYYFSKITNEEMIRYQEYLLNTGVKPATVNKTILVIKTLCKYLEDCELINPMNFKVKKLKEDLPEIKTVSVEDLKRIISYLEHDTIQHQIIFLLQIETGVRRTELCYVKRENINLDNNSIYLERTKNGHPRYIYFDERIKKLIIKQLEQTKSTWLICNPEGKQFTAHGITSFYYRLKKELNVDTLSSHKLRHTFATMLMDVEKDIEKVRLLLGHETYEMTKRYLHVKEDSIKAAALKSNPLSQIFRE